MAVEDKKVVTIGMTSYNYGHFIGEAVESVVTQTSPDWELFIYDNCSTDNTIEVLTPYLSDPRVHLIINETNIGAKPNSIQAIKNAQTAFYSSLQADDFLAPTFVEDALFQFNQNPTSPFVFFDWNQYIQETGASVPHERFPFSVKRSGPVRIGPFLSICNFAPLHMIVFRTECMKLGFDLLLASPIQQVGEQFILKCLEDRFGVGCYSGSLGGAWRRHQQQMTQTNVDSGVALIDEPIERHWYLMQDAERDDLTTYMSLAALIMMSAKVDLFTAAEWLLHDEGQLYAEKFNLPIARDRERFQAIVFVVVFKYSVFTNIMGYSKEKLEYWLTLMNVMPTRTGLKNFLVNVQQKEGESLLNDDEIRDICHYCFQSETQITGNNTAQQQAQLNRDYKHWINKSSWRESEAQLLAERMLLTWQQKPIFHLIMVLAENEQPLLANTLNSLAMQFYPNWQLTIISSLPPSDPLFIESEQLNWCQLDINDDVHQAINNVVNQIPCDWLSYIRPGTQFEAYSLASLADYINIHGHWHAIYTDDDQLDSNGDRCFPRFKPDFNLELLRSSNYMGDLWIKLSSFQIMGGIQALPNAESYDLALRCVDFFGEQAIGHISDVLSHQAQASLNFDAAAGMVALEQHFDRNGINATIDMGLVDNSYRVIYPLESEPSVTIIIANKDKVDLLEVCLDSLFSKTAYANFNVIIVDNVSEDPKTHDYYQRLVTSYPNQISVLQYADSFNFSAMTNLAAAHTQSDYLLLLNNDSQIVQSDWLTRMVQYGQANDVGIVGAKLSFPDTALVQHAGVILGMDQLANHPFVGLININEPGYLDRALLTQQYSAVTAACLLISKPVFDSVSGLDQDQLPSLFNDVDLCLKVKQQGYRIIWTPHAIVVNHGKTLQGADITTFNDSQMKQHMQKVEQQKAVIWKKWLPILANDPAYNRHLRLQADCAIELDNLMPWDSNMAGRIRVLGLHTQQEFTRKLLDQLEQQVIMQTGYLAMSNNEGVIPVSHIDIARIQPNTLVIDGDLNDNTMDLVEKCKAYLETVFRVCVLSFEHAGLFVSNASDGQVSLSATTVQKLTQFDRVIVTNQAMAGLCSTVVDNVVVMPETIFAADFSTTSHYNTVHDKPQVAWVIDSINDDIGSMMVSLIRSTADIIDWIIIGECHYDLSSCIKQAYARPNNADFTLLLSSLQLDMVVHPQQTDVLSKFKSIHPYLSYGMLSYPVLTSTGFELDYQGVHCVENELEQWQSVLSSLISDRQALKQQGRAFRQAVMANNMFEAQLSNWAYALSNQPNAISQGLEFAKAALN